MYFKESLKNDPLTDFEKTDKLTLFYCLSQDVLYL